MMLQRHYFYDYWGRRRCTTRQIRRIVVLHSNDTEDARRRKHARYIIVDDEGIAALSPECAEAGSPSGPSGR